MPIRVYKPTTAGRRNASVNTSPDVARKRPERSLTTPLPKKGGRNHRGVITTRGRGGGHKRLYRRIDFRRRALRGKTAKVEAIEYDPNRTCYIALLEYEGENPDGSKAAKRCYILAPLGLKVGDTVQTSDRAIEPRVGACMPMKHIPTGLNVHCVELRSGRGGQICRSAGAYARLANKEGRYATLVLPSGELRQAPLNCWATVGQVGNVEHQSRRLGKAGKSRHVGRRPKVRGMAMDHATHPLGGGEGRSKGGRAPVGPTGVFSKGGPTRNRKQPSERLIIRRRKSKRYGQLR